MKARLLRSLVVVALVLSGLAAPLPCSGPDCPCAQPEPEPASPCCPDDDACDACVFCLHCDPQDREPAALGSAASEGSAARLLPAAGTHAVVPHAAVPARPGPADAGRSSPAAHAPLHVPTVVLRA